MDEVSSYVRLDLLSVRRQGRPKDCSASSSNPMMEGPWCRFRREARAREQHRHAAVDSLKVLDPKWPIREATKFCDAAKCRDGPIADIPCRLLWQRPYDVNSASNALASFRS